jgi:hypothetical protein
MGLAWLVASSALAATGLRRTGRNMSAEVKATSTGGLAVDLPGVLICPTPPSS